jgi:Arc/MetJ family transcription regulator
MHICTVIDDNLMNQAARLTGVSDNRSLLEYALRLLIQTKIPDNTASANTDSDQAGFWAQLQRYRGSVNLQQFTDVDDIFRNIRDASCGREVEL